MAEDGKKPEAEDDKKPQSAPAADAPSTPATPDPNKPVADDNYEVRVNSYKIVSALGVTAVHNEICFYRNGQPIAAFNGNAHDNKTGERNTFAIGPGSTLRVSAGSPMNMELVGSVTLASNMTPEEYAQKLKDVTAASVYINAQKMEYVVVGGVGYEAQNSNSVAAALIRAMGFNYPDKEFKNLWQPGAKRNLLPDDWSTPNAPLEEFFKWADMIDLKNVIEQVKNDKMPLIQMPYFPNFHDPNKKMEQLPADDAKPNDTHVSEIVSKNVLAATSIDMGNPLSAKADFLKTDAFKLDISKLEGVNSIKASGFTSAIDTPIRTEKSLSAFFANVSSNSPQIGDNKNAEAAILQQYIEQHQGLPTMGKK